MIPGPSIVAVDDNKDQLGALCSSLAKLHAPCLGLHVQDATTRLENPFTTIQLLFLDINLISGAPLGAATYDATATVLSEVIGRENGPYILITWSTFSSHHDELMQHLAKNYPDDIPAPAFTASLRKEAFQEDGGFNTDEISKQIAAIASTNAQVEALMRWVESARIAAAAAASAILDLVPREERFRGGDAERLERLFTMIATESVGKENAQRDPLTAVRVGLGPILLDRVFHANVKGHAEAWKRAISGEANLDSIGDAEKLRLNTMHHISTSRLKSYSAGSRGIVSTLPAFLGENGALENFLGVEKGELIKKYVKLDETATEDEIVESCRWVLVGLKPACDEAQPKPGPHRLLVGLEVSLGDKIKKEKHGALLQVCAFSLDGKKKFLFLNWHFLIALTYAQLADCEILYRVMDSLCSKIELAFADHASRPGTIEFIRK